MGKPDRQQVWVCSRLVRAYSVIFSSVSYFCCRLKAVNVWSNFRVVPFIEDCSPVRVYGDVHCANYINRNKEGDAIFLQKI